MLSRAIQMLISPEGNLTDTLRYIGAILVSILISILINLGTAGQIDK